jgi:hypothetical protein
MLHRRAEMPYTIYRIPYTIVRGYRDRTGSLQYYLGVGFEKIFDLKFENFSIFRIFLHSKIVSNSNRIFLDVRRAYVESRTFLLT